MPKILNLDEMLEIISHISPGEFDKFKAVLEEQGTKMATVISSQLKIHAGPATSEGIGFAGTCAPFSPSRKNQRLPDIFEYLDLDPGGDW